MKNKDEDFIRKNMYEGSKSIIYFKPITNAVLAVFVLFGGLKSSFDFRKMEIENRVQIQTDIELLVYDLTGKWGFLGIALIASGVLFYRTYIQIKSIKKSRI